MDKKTFRSLITPLSEKELLYQKNPALSYQAYSSFSGNESSLIFGGNIFNELCSHGMICLRQPDHENNKNITFSKQTRFSVVPPHKHAYLELNYIYSGNCTANISGTETDLHTGDVCIMDVGVTHTIYPVGEKDIILNCLMRHSYFNTHFIERLAQSGPVARFLASALNDSAEHSQYLIFHTGQNPLMKELFENVICEYLDPALCSDNAIDSYMTLIFIHLARCYQYSKEKEYRENQHSYMTEVLRFIEDSCTDCSLKSTAERFGFHHKYLSRAIHNATGQTFTELVTLARLKKAAFLLRSTDQQISTIARQCGWSNQSQFYKKFHEIYKNTPKTYREIEK